MADGQLSDPVGAAERSTAPTPTVDRVTRFLLERGASPEDIRAAGHGRWLARLVLDLGVLPGERRWTRDDVAARAGVPFSVASAFWRGLGFPDAPPGEKAFTDYDVAALKAAIEGLGGPADLERGVQVTRITAAAMARVAEVWVDMLVDRARELREDPEIEPGDAALRLLAEFDLDKMVPMLDYTYRRQIIAALDRRFGWAAAAEDMLDDEQEVVVGFADLAGYTSLSQELDDGELTELVLRFEAITHDVIAEQGGRLVKMLGDEVMFVAPDVADAAVIALRLLDAHENDELLPAVRVGLDVGPVLAREGDYYGPTVNRAARLVNLARRGTAVVPSDVRDRIKDDERFRCNPIGFRRVKDFGMVWLWALKPGPTPLTEIC